MKIELKLTSDQLFYLRKKLEPLSIIQPQEFIRLKHEKRIENSLLLDCFDKINSKSDTISRKPSIFDQNKKYSISLKYHEAAILGRLCCGLKHSEPIESHDLSLAHSIFLLIDKKTQ